MSIDLTDVPRPQRDEDAYDHPAPVTPISEETENLTMAGILVTFTDEEIREIRYALEHVSSSPMTVWLWSMFDSISVPEVTR